MSLSRALDEGGCPNVMCQIFKMNMSLVFVTRKIHTPTVNNQI